MLRHRIFTYATLLGREARAAGINACFEDVEAKRKFEAASFRDALRRVKPRRKKAEAAPAAPGAPGAPAAPASPAAPATSAAPAAPAGTKPS